MHTKRNLAISSNPTDIVAAYLSDPELRKSIEEGAKSMAPYVWSSVKEWTQDKIKSFAEKFKRGDKDLLLVGNPENLNDSNGITTSAEYRLLEYIRDPILKHKLSELLQVGLILRKYDENKKVDAIGSLKEKIHARHKEEGVRITQFFQNKCFPILVSNLQTSLSTVDEVSKEMEDFFNHFNQRAMFIRKNSIAEKNAEAIRIMVIAHGPRTFIISATESLAIKICDDTIEILDKQLENYQFESYSTNQKQIYFLNRIDVKD